MNCRRISRWGWERWMQGVRLRRGPCTMRMEGSRWWWFIAAGRPWRLRPERRSSESPPQCCQRAARLEWGTLGFYFLFSDVILARDQAAGILLCGDMTEANVVRQRAEERNSVSDEHRDTSD